MPSRRDVLFAAMIVCMLASGITTVGYSMSATIPGVKTVASSIRTIDQPGEWRAPSSAGSVAKARPRATDRSAAASPSGPRSARQPVGAADPSRSPNPAASPSVSPSPERSARSTVGPLSSKILTGSSAVALTFDDGPDPATTPQVLDLLKQYQVKATFCVIGSRARDYPDLIKRIVAEGHAICNHSWQHLLNLGQREFSYQNWDLRSTNDAIHAAAPDAQIRYFRAPGGSFTQGMIDLAASLGMASLYWDVDPRDWDATSFGKGPSMVNHIVGAVQQAARPGSIILSHDRSKPDTVTAYGTLLPWLKTRFTLIPLP